MWLKVLVIFLVSLIQTSICKHEKYDGYIVYDIPIKSQEDNSVIERLRDELNLDVWSYGSPGLRSATVMVSPDNRENFVKEISKNKMPYKIREENVVRALRQFDEDCSRSSKSRNQQQPYTYYARLSEIESYMERLSTEYPQIVTLVTAGLSFEGRPIKYLKISTTNFEDPNKPIYFIDATMHGREWISTPVALYMIHKLVEDLQEDERDLLDNIDWVILPVYNPDGYEYSHTDDRMWRKSRSFNASNSDCYGVDLNRNFDIFFGETDASLDPCSGAYIGPYAFSEIENRHVRDALNAYLDRIQIYMNIHSYGSYLLYGFDNATLPDNVQQIHHVGATMGAHIDAMKLPEVYHYAVGSSRYVLYPASGTAQDYAQNLGVPFSYTLELPDFMRYGFLLPPEYIPQVNRETWSGITALARTALLFYRERLKNE